MASYRLRWKRSAQKDLKTLPKPYILQILAAVEELAQNPYQRGIRKLSSTEYAYRRRVGPYRILYTVVETDRIIEVIKIRHRKEVYRKE